MTQEELINAFKYIVKKCDMLINNNDYKADVYTQDTVEDIAELCNHILDGDYGKLVKVKYDSLEKFKSLQHVDRDLHQTLRNWGYAPNLYFFDGMWHVSWISCEEGDCIKDFESNTPEEAIDKAYNWFHSTFCND